MALCYGMDDFRMRDGCPRAEFLLNGWRLEISWIAKREPLLNNQVENTYRSAENACSVPGQLTRNYWAAPGQFLFAFAPQGFSIYSASDVDSGSGSAPKACIVSE